MAAEDEAVLSAAERVDIHRALEQLDPAERLLIRLRYEDDLTQAAIARLLKLPEGTVKVRLHRTRTKLRRAYGQDDDQYRKNN